MEEDILVVKLAKLIKDFAGELRQELEGIKKRLDALEHQISGKNKTPWKEVI